MVYIETLIQCQNCDREKKLYGEQCIDITDIVNYFQYNCCKCQRSLCDECMLVDTEVNQYCESCYFKHVQKGLMEVKN